MNGYSEINKLFHDLVLIKIGGNLSCKYIMKSLSELTFHVALLLSFTPGLPKLQYNVCTRHAALKRDVSFKSERNIYSYLLQ